MSHNLQSLIDFISSARNLSFDEDAAFERISAAIQSRLSELSFSNAEQYRDHLEVHPQEYQHLLRNFFTSKSFLIDEPIWERLKPALAARLQTSSPLRAWCIGCGRGSEVIGTVIALSELNANASTASQMKVFATDTNDDTLAIARQCSFSPTELQQALTSATLSKYFSQSNDRYSVASDVRRSIIFGKHDVASDPAIGRMDLIICRGVLSLFNADEQARIAAMLMQALNDNGQLILDCCERLPPYLEAMPLLNIPFAYQKNSTKNANSRTLLNDVNEDTDEHSLIDASFDAKPVPTICVDASGIVSAVNSHARFAFNLAALDLGKPLQDLEISYRPIELRSLIDAAYNAHQEIVVNRVVRNTSSSEQQLFDVYVFPLFEGTEPIGVCIEYHDSTETYKLRDDLLTFNHQLQTANEELQSAHEELETTNEELHSTNEELETTNEELQSTNEELETMNEELQSTNTELEFSNTGQRDLATAVEQVNSFLESILRSIQFAIVVVDPKCNIQVWNQKCVDLWGLRPDEVKGQNLFSLDIGFPVQKLAERFEESAQGNTVAPFTTSAINRRGQTIECEVNFQPLAHSPGYIVIIDEVIGD